jgi:uncharacterized membrane protein
VSALESLTRPRTLAVLLAVSLAVNLFLAGIFAGRLGARHGEPHGMPVFGLGGPGFESGFRRLPRGEREHLRSVLHERRPELRAQHAALRKVHEEIAEELKRDKPDRALIEGKLGEIRAQTAKIEQEMQAAFLDRMLAMDAAARKDVVERMLRHHPGHRMRPGPPPGDAPPFEPGEPAPPPAGQPPEQGPG